MLPVDSRTAMLFFTDFVQVRPKKGMHPLWGTTRDETRKNNGHVSLYTLGSDKSALKSYCEDFGKTPERGFWAALGKLVGHAYKMAEWEQNGEVAAGSGRSPFTFEGYQVLMKAARRIRPSATLMSTGSRRSGGPQAQRTWTTSTLATTFLSLQWNMRCRGASTAGVIMWSHMAWPADHFRLEAGKDKTKKKISSIHSQRRVHRWTRSYESRIRKIDFTLIPPNTRRFHNDFTHIHTFTPTFTQPELVEIQNPSNGKSKKGKRSISNLHLIFSLF